MVSSRTHDDMVKNVRELCSRALRREGVRQERSHVGRGRRSQRKANKQRTTESRPVSVSKTIDE